LNGFISNVDRIYAFTKELYGCFLGKERREEGDENMQLNTMTSSILFCFCFVCFEVYFTSTQY
jgi:hypothetical protein